MLLAHLFKSEDAIIGSGELFLEHGDIRLAALRDTSLTGQLSLHRVQMVCVDRKLGAAICLILL